jgi:hypothetical protein
MARLRSRIQDLLAAATPALVLLFDVARRWQ